MRGTFANIRIRNEMLGGEEGGNTIYIPSGEKCRFTMPPCVIRPRARRWW